MKPYRFVPEAEAEFHEQIRYFDEQAAGLGDKFLADVHATVTDIRSYPESGERVSQNIRRRVLRVFKNSVFYANEQNEIVVVAVAPHKRRPGYWRKRLQDTEQ